MTTGVQPPVLHLPDSAPPVLDGTTTLDRDGLATILKERIALGARWLTQSVGPDGWMTYYYQPRSDRIFMDDYNEVRHAGTTYAMFQAYEVLGDPALLDAAERAVSWLVASCVPTRYGGRAFCQKNQCILGGQALALVALLERRRVLQDTSCDDVIADLAIFLDVMELQDKPGQHFEIFRPNRDRFSTTDGPSYSPGEVLLAQVRLAQHFPDGPFVDAANRVADYLVYRREGDIPAAGVAPRADHWMAMALSELYPMTGHPHHALAATLIGDLMRANQYGPEDTHWRLVGANRRGESANYTATATKGEALMAVWDLAVARGDATGVERFSESALRNVQFGMRVQYTPELSKKFPNPARVTGGWAQDERVADIRMDYVQHNVSALIGAWHLLTHGRLPAGRLQSSPGAEIAVHIPVVGREIFTGPGFHSVKPAVVVVIDTQALPALVVPARQDIRAMVEEVMGAVHEADEMFRPLADLTQGDGETVDLGEAVACALSDVLQAAGWTAGNSRSRQRLDGSYEIVCEIEEENAAEGAVEVAIAIVEDLINDRRRALTQARRHAESLFKSPYPQNGGITPRLHTEARRRGIRYYERTDKQAFIEFGTGRFQKQMRRAVTSESKALGHRIARNKNLAANVMREAGLPAPVNRRVRSAQAAVRAAEEIGYPVVLKPLDGSQSRGVFPGVSSSQEVRRIFPESKSVSVHGDVIVEKYLEGESFRIFLAGQEVVGVLERRAAEVTGDGIHTVRELIDMENASFARQPRPDNYLEPIDINNQTMLALKWQGLELDAVPEYRRVVRLKLIPSGSNGGTRIDRLSETHPDNLEIARQAAATVDLAVTGIDFISPDITRSVWETGGGIVEINGAPAYYPHCRTTSGRSFEPVISVMEMLFPPGERSQIHAITISGIEGEAEIAEILEKLIAAPHRLVGIAGHESVKLAGMRVNRVDDGGPTPVQIVVRNPMLDTAILMPTAKDFAVPGLEIDEVDVAIVGSVAGSRGDAGTMSIQEVLVRMAGTSGTVVAESGDNDAIPLLSGHPGPVILVSSTGHNSQIANHLKRGSVAVLANEQDRSIVLCSENEVCQPLAIGIADGVSLRSVAFAAAGAIAFGLDPESTAAALLTPDLASPRGEMS